MMNSLEKRQKAVKLAVFCALITILVTLLTPFALADTLSKEDFKTKYGEDRVKIAEEIEAICKEYVDCDALRMSQPLTIEQSKTDFYDKIEKYETDYDAKYTDYNFNTFYSDFLKTYTYTDGYAYSTKTDIANYVNRNASSPISESGTKWRQNYESWYTQVKSVIETGLIDTVQDVFGSKTVSSQEASTEVQKALHSSSDTVTINTNISKQAKASTQSVVDDISNVFQALGYCLIIIFSLVGLIKDIQRMPDGGINLWAKYAIACVIGVVVVANYSLIISGCEKIGQYIIDVVQNRVSNSSDMSSLIEFCDKYLSYGDDDIREVSFSLTSMTWADTLLDNITIYFWTFVKYIGTFVVFTAIIVPILGCKIALYTIWIELTIRKVFFPLAVADVCEEGMRSAGYIYIKKMVAQYVRIAICFMIAFLGSALITVVLSYYSDVTGVVDLLVKVLSLASLYTASAKLMSNTAGIANQIVGV